MITYSYTKLTKAIPTTNTIPVTVAFIFLENWAANYFIPSNLLTENDLQFVSKFLAAVCSTLGLNNITTTEFHPQAKGLAERFISTSISQYRHHMFEPQTDSDNYPLPLTYAYDVQMCRFMKVSPYSSTLTRTALHRPLSPQEAPTRPATTKWPHLCIRG